MLTAATLVGSHMAVKSTPQKTSGLLRAKDFKTAVKVFLKDSKTMVLEIYGALLQTHNGEEFPVRLRATIAGTHTVEENT